MTTQPSIVVEVRDVYGIPKVYPVCAKARLFAEIAGSKTLTHATLTRVESLGYLIVDNDDSRARGWRRAR
jgi:hypothetical protein